MRLQIRELPAAHHHDHRRCAVPGAQPGDPDPLPAGRASAQLHPRQQRTRPAYRVATADPPDQTTDPLQWERPILYAQGDLGGGRLLHVMNLHLKSKIATNIQGQKLDDFTPEDPRGAGRSDEVPLQAIGGQVEDTGNPAHGPRVMMACENQVAESARYSLFHLGRGEMIDHVLASRALLATLDHSEVHNEYLPDESGAFRTDVKSPSPTMPRWWPSSACLTAEQYRRSDRSVAFLSSAT